MGKKDEEDEKATNACGGSDKGTDTGGEEEIGRGK